jgi:hypothetical protein
MSCGVESCGVMPSETSLSLHFGLGERTPSASRSWRGSSGGVPAGANIANHANISAPRCRLRPWSARRKLRVARLHRRRERADLAGLPLTHERRQPGGEDLHVALQERRQRFLRALVGT